MSLGVIYGSFIESSENGVYGRFENDIKLHFERFTALLWMVERMIE
jgi:hypothetical protein